MICQDCGVEAHTRHVSFHQNIGLLVVRFPSSIQGRLCKSCIHRHFWKMTGTTMFLGWWGTISFVMTPFFLLNNIGRYLFCMTMPPVPPGAAPPVLTEQAVEQLLPHADELFSRLHADEDFMTVANSMANKAGVTAGQVALFIQAVAQSQAEAEGQQARQ